MQNESTEFRDRLLGAQQMTPALREEYRKELDAILNYKLTPRARALTWGGIVVAIAFAALSVRGLILYHGKPGLKLIFPAYLAVAAGTVLWLGRVLWQGGFARRTSYAVIEGLGGIFTGAYITVVFLRGMHTPSDPANLMAAIWAVMLIMVGFAWGTGNRIAAAALETRAHLLRMESRLADLAERLPK
jgi:hypothetical protein